MPASHKLRGFVVGGGAGDPGFESRRAHQNFNNYSYNPSIDMFERFISLTYKILNILKSRNIEGDVYCEYCRGISVECQEGKFREVAEVEECGIGLRVIIDNRIGFVHVSNPDESPDVIVERACKIARLCSKIEKWRGLPYSANRSNVSDIFSRKLVDINVEDLILNVNEFLRYHEKDKDIFSVWTAGLEVTYFRKFILNTYNVELESEETISIAGIEVNAHEKGYTTPGVFDIDYSRVDLIDIVKLYEKCREKARSLLNPTKLDTSRIDVVLSPKALSHLLDFTILPMLTSRSFALKRSPFRDKIGEKLFSNEFTLIDNATMPGGLESTPFDDEGIRTRRNVLIENGVLKNAISDIYWGSLANMESTGNGFRDSYYTAPSVHYSNIEIPPGSTELEELYSSKILLIDDVQGAHSSNPESGEFSVAAPCTWIIEKGGKKPVRGVMIAGNMYDILKVAKFTKEREKFYSFTIPYIYIPEDNITITS